MFIFAADRRRVISSLRHYAATPISFAAAAATPIMRTSARRDITMIRRQLIADDAAIS